MPELGAADFWIGAVFGFMVAVVFSWYWLIRPMGRLLGFEKGQGKFFDKGATPSMVLLTDRENSGETWTASSRPHRRLFFNRIRRGIGLFRLWRDSREPDGTG